MYPNRTICTVLQEMRACYKTRNFASLNGLIEEAQAMGNRMESGLYDKKDVERMREERGELHKELKELRKEKKKLDPEDTNEN